MIFYILGSIDVTCRYMAKSSYPNANANANANEDACLTYFTFMDPPNSLSQELRMMKKSDEKKGIFRFQPVHSFIGIKDTPFFTCRCSSDLFSELRTGRRPGSWRLIMGKSLLILILTLILTSMVSSFCCADETIDRELNEAYILFQQGKLEGAREKYEQVIEKNYDNFKAHFSLGVIFQIQRKDEQALGHYQICTDIDPSFAPTYNNIGWIFFARGEYNKAQLAYMQALEKDPGYILAYNNLGIVFLIGGETDTARFIFEKVLTLQPGNIMALNNLGLVYESRGEGEEAKKKYNEVLMKDPGNICARANLARVFMDEGSWGKAGKIYNQLEEERPDSPLSTFSLAEFFHRTGDLKRSERYLRKTLKLQPSHFSAREILAEILINQKRYNEALFNLLRLREQAPGDPGVLLSLGTAYYYLDDYPASTIYLSEALKKNPSSTSAMTYLGLINEENSDYNRAFFYFYKCYLSNPINLQNKQNLARVYLKIGKLQEGEALIDGMLREYPDNADALCLKSFILWKMKRKEDSFKILRKILRMNPEHAKANFYYGIFQCIEGNEKVGMKFIAKSVKENWKILKDVKKFPRIYEKFKINVK